MTDMPELPSQPQQAAIWPPPVFQEDAVLARAPFFQQRGVETAVKVMAGIYAVSLIFDVVENANPRFLAPGLSSVFAIAELCIFVVLVVVYLRWVYGVTRNLRSFRTAEPYTGPGWAAGSYIVPIISLYRPCINMGQLWRASNPAVDSRDRAAWMKSKSTGLIGLWWALFLLWDISSLVASRAAISPAVTESARAATVADSYAVAAVFGIAGLLCMCRLVSRVNTRQEAKDEALSQEERTL